MMSLDPRQPRRTHGAGRVAPLGVLPGGTGNLLARNLGLPVGDPISATARTVVVANLATLPGGVALLPEALPDDGILDMAIIESHNLADWLRVTSRVMTRRTRVDDRYTTHHAQHVQISMRSATPRQADGGMIGDHTAMDVQIEAGALLVIGHDHSP